MIAKVQAPNMGQEALPSKYYHTIAASYTSCSLIREGLPGLLVNFIQLSSVRTYRLARLCKGQMGVPQQQVEDLINYMRQHNLDTKELAQILSKPSLTWPDGLKWVWDLISIILGDVFASDPELIESKIKTAISFYDARNLFLQKVIGGDSSQCNKPRGSDHIVRKMKSVARWHQCKGTQLEKERCGLAKERLLTWWADMEWTQELHKKGVKFALKNCKKDPDFIENIDEIACEALKKIPTPESEVLEEGADGEVTP